jgi:hypothetical protein
MPTKTNSEHQIHQPHWFPKQLLMPTLNLILLKIEKYGPFQAISLVL